MIFFSVLQFAGGGTALKSAIHYVNTELYLQRNRTEAKKVIVLLTDGHFNNDEDPEEQLQRLGRKKDNSMFFALPTISISLSRCSEDIQ